MIGRTEGEFSVVQFFVSNEHEYVRKFVGLEEAVEAFRHYTNSVAVKMGFVEQVIITDGGDMTCAQWTKDQGLIWPNKEDPEPENTEAVFDELSFSEDADYQPSPRDEERAFGLMNQNEDEQP